jgi:hypothetical protein
MRKTTLLLFILALISGTNVFGQIAGTPYTIAAPGGINFEIPGSLASVTAGSARIQPATGAVPAGMALFALRQNGILIGEATVPAAERAYRHRDCQSQRASRHDPFLFHRQRRHELIFRHIHPCAQFTNRSFSR